MKKDELTTTVENQEPQTQEVKVNSIVVSEKDKNVFDLSREKRVAIPLLPFKDIFLPYANITVKMRKPIVRDIKALANITNQEIKTYHLISNLTGLSMDEIEMFDYPDFSVLNKELESFL